MSVRHLDKVFRPQRIAVVGASDDPTKVGYMVLRNLVGHGYEGVVYPVNSRREAVQGIAAYPRLGDLPHVPDLAILCTPAATVAGLIRECGECGILGVVIISAGFREIGDRGRALEEEVRVAAASSPGLRILGPNCLGFMVPGRKLNASFAAESLPAGRVAFISQSGALGTAVVDWAQAEGVGFSLFASMGNMLDIGFDDLLDYLAADEQTSAVMLYVESITAARNFMSAARALAREKPIVVCKAGRFAESAQAASSHTGAMAGVDEVYDAAFRRAGIVRVSDVDELFDCAEMLSKEKRLPQGERLAIVTNAGGPGVMATDALLARRGSLAELDAGTTERLDAILPPAWSHGNPVDVLGDAPADRYGQALDIVLKSEQVDAAVVVLTPQAMTEPLGTARAVIQAAKTAHKPVLTSWMGEKSVRSAVDLLNRAGIPTYRTPEQAVRAFMHLVAYKRRRELLYVTPRDVPLAFRLDRAALRARFEELARPGQSVLSEDDSKALLDAYDIPVTNTSPAATADEAVTLAEACGYPVVLKVLSSQITHKTDVGGVVLDLANAAAVRQAFEQIVSSAHEHRPDAEVLGVTVQRMVSFARGVELIVGAKTDPVFGPVIMVGLGGVTAELLEDHALELPPLDETLARRMLESLRSWPLLAGYRGRPALAVDRLIEVLIRFSYLIAELPEVVEVDLNPLVVTPDEVIAVDARVFVDRNRTGVPGRRYSHLAICPYPEEFTSEHELKDGTRVTLRPIRPSDEPAWHDLLARCSAETLYNRFRYLFKEATHEMASRFCYVDYDREIALVAEVEQEGRRMLVGVGRLVADPDHETAEYAVLVSDAFHGRGLGTLLTNSCLSIAERWGIRSVCGETASDNVRMLHLFRAAGFTLDHAKYPGVILAHRDLSPDDAS